MATFTTDTTGASLALGNGANAAGFPAQTVIVATFDAAKRGLAAGDTAEIFTVPANTIINNVVADVLTVDDATHVYNVGTLTDPDGFVVGDAADATGKTVGAGALVGTLLTTADSLVVEAATLDPLDTLKVTVYIDCTILG